METTLTILMVLGIFVGIPALIGFAIAGVYILRGQRARDTETITEAHDQAVAEKHVGVA